MRPGPDLWTALAVIMFGRLAWYRYERGWNLGDPLVDWRFLRAAVIPVVLFTIAAFVLEGVVIRG